MLIIFKSLLLTIQTPPGLNDMIIMSIHIRDRACIWWQREFDLKINNQISGKVKFGFKNRDKTREHDRDYNMVHSPMLPMGKRNETYEMFDWLSSIPQILYMPITTLSWIKIIMMRGF